MPAGLELEVTDSEFRAGMHDAVEQGLATRPGGPGDLQEWLHTGLSNRIQPRFVALHIPAWTSFFVHAHPGQSTVEIVGDVSVSVGLEIAYMVKGSMHEVRLTSPAQVDREVSVRRVVRMTVCDQCTASVAPYDLKDSNYKFEHNLFESGRWVVNEVYQRSEARSSHGTHRWVLYTNLTLKKRIVFY